MKAHEKEFEEISFGYTDEHGVIFVDGYSMTPEEDECLGYIFGQEFYPKDNDIYTNKQVMEAVNEHLVEIRKEAEQVRMFHISTHDREAGSLGIIKGATPEELNAALRHAIQKTFDAEGDTLTIPEIDWGFWHSQHMEDVIVSFLHYRQPRNETIQLTYTWKA